METIQTIAVAEAALFTAIAAVGSRAELARRLNISRAAVAQWTRTPVGRVLDVERETGVGREILRPDIYSADVPRPAPADAEAGR